MTDKKFRCVSCFVTYQQSELKDPDWSASKTWEFIASHQDEDWPWPDQFPYKQCACPKCGDACVLDLPILPPGDTQVPGLTSVPPDKESIATLHRRICIFLEACGPVHNIQEDGSADGGATTFEVLIYLGLVPEGEALSHRSQRLSEISRAGIGIMRTIYWRINPATKKRCAIYIIFRDSAKYREHPLFKERFDSITEENKRLTELRRDIERMASQRNEILYQIYYDIAAFERQQGGATAS